MNHAELVCDFCGFRTELYNTSKFVEHMNTHAIKSSNDVTDKESEK